MFQTLILHYALQMWLVVYIFVTSNWYELKLAAAAVVWGTKMEYCFKVTPSIKLAIL